MTHDEAAQLSGYVIPSNWRIQPVERAGQVIGFFIVKDNEIHCWRHEDAEGRWLTHQDIWKVSEPLIQAYGVVKTRVRKNNLQGIRFCSRMGFKPVGEDECSVILEARSIKHARL